MTSPPYHQELITLLTKKILPWWEQNGIDRLVVSANTLKQFKAQPLPQSIDVSVKKRQGRKVAVRGPRTFNNTSYRIALWPKDGQHSIRYPALACVLRGQADFHIADYVVHCPPNHFVLFDSNVPLPVDRPHFTGTDFSQRYCEVLWIMAQPGTTNHISSWICYSEGKKHWAQTLVDYCLIDRPEKVTFFNTFTHEITQNSSDSRKLAEVSFHAFLLLFIRELSEGKFPLPSSTNTQSKGAPYTPVNPIELAVQHIDYNFGQNLTTQSVADAVYMSRSNFIRKFQPETGQTFNQYLTNRRLKEARRLLTEGTRSINSVARLVGLSPSHLRALFGKKFGVTPSEFILSHKNETK